MYKAGDVVRIIDDTQLKPWCQIGDVAKIIKKDSDGDWLLNFNYQGNSRIVEDGFFYIDETMFELVELIYSVAAINNSGDVIPLYFGLNKEAAQKEFSFYDSQKEARDFKQVILLKQVV